MVPTWEAWFRLLDELVSESSALQLLASDREIQARLLRAQQSLVHEYSVNGRDQHDDVVAVYGRLSGCKREVMIAAPDSSYLGLGVAPPDLAQHCNTSTPVCWDKFEASGLCSGPMFTAYRSFLVEADLKSPYTGDADSKSCFFKGLEYLQAHPTKIGATTLRALLAQCQDANELNTGTGFGYNTYPNPTSFEDDCGAYWDPDPSPGEQTVLQQLTGREFIVVNRRLRDLPRFTHVPLIFSTTDRKYLRSGYCTD